MSGSECTGLLDWMFRDAVEFNDVDDQASAALAAGRDGHQHLASVQSCEDSRISLGSHRVLASLRDAFIQHRTSHCLLIHRQARELVKVDCAFSSRRRSCRSSNERQFRRRGGEHMLLRSQGIMCAAGLRADDSCGGRSAWVS